MGAIPATPIATFAMPVRQGRPKVSVMTTATSTPAISRSRSRIAAALASGSTGSKLTISPPGMLVRSTPALAQMKP